MDGTPSVTLHKETIAQVMAEIQPLLPRHWDELARNKDKIALNPNMAFYRRNEQLGGVHVFTVRHDGALVGYVVHFVREHPHYVPHLWAVSDIFWLSPDHRGLGIGKAMFEHAEKWLKERGVSVVHYTYKASNLAAGEVLEDLGYPLIEHGRAKCLI